MSALRVRILNGWSSAIIMVGLHPQKKFDIKGPK